MAAAAKDEVTLAEAAQLLGVHPNTVRNRIRAGAIEARKVPMGYGPEVYLIPRAQLVRPGPARFSREWWLQFWPADERQQRVLIAAWVLTGLAWVFSLGRLYEMVRQEFGRDR